MESVNTDTQSVICSSFGWFNQFKLILGPFGIKILVFYRATRTQGCNEERLCFHTATFNADCFAAAAANQSIELWLRHHVQETSAVNVLTLGLILDMHFFE